MYICACACACACACVRESRLLEEEASKRTELEQLHLRQQKAISQTEAEKQELENERLVKETALQAAMVQLEQLESDRQGALQQYQVRSRPQLLISYYYLCVYELVSFLICGDDLGGLKQFFLDHSHSLPYAFRAVWYYTATYILSLLGQLTKHKTLPLTKSAETIVPFYSQTYIFKKVVSVAN